jgi:hypothetical protein
MVQELWIFEVDWVAKILFGTKSGIPQNLNFSPQIECNLRDLPIWTLYLTFSTFRQLLMRHNQTNDSGVMVSGSCRWLLEFLIWTEWDNFSTSGFKRNRSKIWGDPEYQSHRESHKLYKESGISKFWYWMKEPWTVEVERIIKIWLRIGINFLSFFWFSRLASWCNMNVWCHASCQPYTFLTKRKGLPNIDGVCIVSDKLHSIPWLALTIRLTKRG